MENEAPRKDAIHSVSIGKSEDLTPPIYMTRTLMGEAAACAVADKISDLLKVQEFVNIIFAAAPSQNEFLASLMQKTNIDWTRVNAFHMDEYIGLSKNDRRTFAAFLDEKVFSKKPFRSVNYINGNTEDLNAECNRYAKLLNQFPPDLICMGIGENGHIAFNDPPVADFNDPFTMKVVELDAECRQQQVNDGCFSQLDDVPTHALTLTIPTLMAGRYIYCIVPGEKKARAVYNTLHQEANEKYPSTILRSHANAVLFLDRDSSALL
jgi:glucosamine-6-phosphate deaminase